MRFASVGDGDCFVAKCVLRSHCFAAYWLRYELIGEILNDRNTIAFQYRMCPAPAFRKCVGMTPAKYRHLHG